MRNNLVLTQRRRLALAAGVFVLPSVALFVAFLAAPLLYSLYISFNEWSMMRDPVWLGLDNYRRIFDDDIFWRSLRNTVVFTVLFVPLVTITSLGSAVLLNQGIRATGIFKALIFIPVITPSVVVGVVWTYVFQPELGLLNELLRHAPSADESLAREQPASRCRRSCWSRSGSGSAGS